MQENSLVTVVTVCFNAAKTIRETLESVQAQDYPNIEHLIVDGGSKDGTLEIVRQHGDARTRWVSERDKGIYDAMNKGWRMAGGAIVGYLNADDHFLDTGVISHVVDVFRRHPDGQWGYGITQILNAENGTTVDLGQPPPPRLGAWTKRAMNLSGCAHPTVYAKREVFREIGDFDESLRICGDTDWLIRLWERHAPLFFAKRMSVLILGGASSKQAVVTELLKVHNRHYPNLVLNYLAYLRHMAGYYARNHFAYLLHKPYIAARKLILRDR